MNFKYKVAKIKDKLKGSRKGPIILTGIIILFVIGAISALIATIYLSGSSIGEFLGKYYPWFVLGLVVIIVVVLTIVLTKVKKGK